MAIEVSSLGKCRINYFSFSLHLSREPNVIQSVIHLYTREDLGMLACGVADMAIAVHA